MNGLKGVTVLVTRPQTRALQLADIIRTMQGNDIIFPTIEITAPQDMTAVKRAIYSFNESDIAIFISHHAVEYGLGYLAAEKIIPSQQVRIAAIGEGTAKCLIQHGLRVDIVPQHEFNSEALLQHHALRHIEGKKIILFRGEGGRTLLANTLRERGATVIDAVVYCRRKPQIDMTQWWPLLTRQPIDIVVTTSHDGLLNLTEIFSQEYRDWLYRLPLLVISQRMLTMALQLGFQRENIVVATPSDQAIVATIAHWYLSRKIDGNAH